MVDTMTQDLSISDETEFGAESRHRRHPLDLKRKVAELCLKPGASVSRVALSHRVNANLVRKWVKKYQAGDYGPVAGQLLPVTVAEEPAARAEVKSAAAPRQPEGYIEIEMRGARVRLYGRVDTETLQALLRSLGR